MADKFTIELTTLAENQILKIAQYIRDEFKSPLSADRFIDKIEGEISKLDTNPDRIVLVEKEPWRSRGLHKYVIGNYIVYFIIVEHDKIVRVMAVVPYKMDQEKQLKKIDL